MTTATQKFLQEEELLRLPTQTSTFHLVAAGDDDDYGDDEDYDDEDYGLDDPYEDDNYEDDIAYEEDDEDDEE